MKVPVLLSFLLFILMSCTSGTPPLVVSTDSAPTLNPALDKMPSAASAWLPVKKPDTISNDYQAAAENETLQLYINPANAAIIVLDKRSNHIWSSVPAGAASNPDLAGVWKRRSPIPLAVEYTSADRTSVKVVRPEDMQITTSPVENGAKVQVNIPSAGFTLTLFITLNGDVIEVTIPDSSVTETSENGLVSVQILPFFGAAADTDPGYLVFPDGSGMLVDFRSPRRAEVQETSRPIYGEDQLTPPAGTGALTPFTRQPVVMPVFGLNNGNDAFLGIITHGDFDATISMARAGTGMPYNRIWGEFVFRRQGMFSLDGDAPVVLYQPGRIGGDRQIRYTFLSGKAGYADMAARYRDYLIERGAKRVPANAPLMDLHFFMGVEQRTWFLRDFITLTTFANVQEMVDRLVADGVSRFDVTLEGWNNGGVNAHYPERLPAESQHGDSSGLRALADALHKHSQRLFLHDNYLNILPGATGAFPIIDAVRGVDGLPVGDGDTGYFLNPQVALRNFAARDIPQMKTFGTDGLYLQDFAAIAAPDGNLRYPLSRENFAASWMQIAGLAQATFGSASLDGGNIYALNFADRLENVPLDGTGYDLSDDTIPFYQIAVHGLVQYTGAPINLSSDPRRSFLRHIEYGAMPTFTLTQNDTALLYHTTTNNLWSGQFSTWRAEVLKDYQSTQRLAALQSQFITNHEKLADSVYQVTYESGSRIIVNYSIHPYSTNTISVNAQDFIVIP